VAKIMARLRYPLRVIRPYNDRTAWAQERAEIPEQIAALKREFAAAPTAHTPRRERFGWTIRRLEKRRAEA
jgi:hypothetical protein